MRDFAIFKTVCGDFVAVNLEKVVDAYPAGDGTQIILECDEAITTVCPFIRFVKHQKFDGYSRFLAGPEAIEFERGAR